MKAQDSFFPSRGIGSIHVRTWLPETEPRAVVQIVHGIAEMVERYDDFADFLTGHGIAVVAEDHMGHGYSIGSEGTQGYFEGGWFTAVEDTCELLRQTKEKYPGVPYVLFGHSMGSFMARTILCKYPDIGLAAAIICGTGWQPTAAMPAMIAIAKAVCRISGEKKPSPFLQAAAFGSYNNKVEHKRTVCDWLTRDDAVVDAYMAHPLCGFIPSAGLFRDMMTGIYYIQQSKNLALMDKQLSVYFVAGAMDPVGSYGKGVHKAAAAFRQAGMKDVSEKLFPLCRHEILNEINKDEVYRDILSWIEKKI